MIRTSQRLLVGLGSLCCLVLCPGSLPSGPSEGLDSLWALSSLSCSSPLWLLGRWSWRHHLCSPHHQPLRPRSRAWLSSSRDPATPAPGHLSDRGGCCLVQGLALLRGLRLERACNREPRVDGASRGSAGFSEPGRDSPQRQGPAAQLKGSLHGCVLGDSQDWSQNLHWGPAQNESVGALFKNY